ncbi:hypothetical protein H2200_005069 [Cladophialophora chaetospira]|uniref:Aminoglycoside phosphotransferase domain-containing protein n=1 Tax=Cladophialophora chaetospira TaxID=386627 RepID=A0AA39CJ88_9EURO|nr:hypothetical protein H2200_005069 [Cladophialophora chaetospira]
MAPHLDELTSLVDPDNESRTDNFHEAVITGPPQTVNDDGTNSPPAEDATDSPPAEDDAGSDSDLDSGVDATSTIVYDQESFSTFQVRVKKLVLETIWPGTNEDHVTVERLTGGGYNRIIGITRQIKHQPKDGKHCWPGKLIWKRFWSGAKRRRLHMSTPDEYILRIPRFEGARLDRDIAILQFIHRYTTIPAPTVLAFDVKSENPLKSPYMVQNRIKGTDLFHLFPKLAHEDRCRVARELGNILNQMLAVESSVAGVVTFSEDQQNLNAPIYVANFPKVEPQETPVPYCRGRTTRPVRELLTDIFEAHRAVYIQKSPNSDFMPEIMNSLCTMAAELESAGWLTNLPNCLAHLDFAPRNILADPASAPTEPIITAVLDWDSAVVGPIFMACTPPLWIWGWQDDDDEDERTANDEPSDPKNRELKHIFEEAAGKEYIHYAYEPVYRLARRLVRFAMENLRSGEDFPEKDEMLAEWASIRKLRQEHLQSTAIG